MRMSRNLCRTVGVAGITTALIVGTWQSASASTSLSEGDPPTTAETRAGGTTLPQAAPHSSSAGDDVASQIAKVAPDQGAVVPSTTAGALSANPADPITVPGGGDSSLAVLLPSEAAVGAATLTSDGTVVYGGTGEDAVDVAVQAMDDGGVRIQTVINAPSSAHEFTYALEDGFQIAEAADGSIWAVGFTEAGEFQAYSVGNAWARDATGAEVSTHYEVRGNELVQVVSPTESTVYPVVADPTWQWYAAAYGAGFSKAETSTMASAGAVSGFCVLVPPGPLQLACGVAGAYWFTQAGLAANAGGCVFLAAAPAPLAMRWDSPECR